MLVGNDITSSEVLLKFLNRSGVHARILQPGIDKLEVADTRAKLAILIVSDDLASEQLPSQPEQLAEVVVVAVTSPQLEPPGLFAQLQRIQLADSSAAFWDSLRAASITPATESLLLPRGIAALPSRRWWRYVAVPLVLLAVSWLGVVAGTEDSRPREQRAIAEAIDDGVDPVLGDYFKEAERFLRVIEGMMSAAPQGVSEIVAMRSMLSRPIDRLNVAFTKFDQAHALSLVELGRAPISAPVVTKYEGLMNDVVDYHWTKLRSELNTNVLSHLFAIDERDTTAAPRMALERARASWNALALQAALKRLSERHAELLKEARDSRR